MDDAFYVAELQAILTRPVPPSGGVGRSSLSGDGIDRSDRFGTDLRVTSLDVQPGLHGDELLVRFDLSLPEQVRFRNVPRAGSAQVPFDAEWRQLSSYDAPASYAPEVARAVEQAAHLLVEKYADEPQRTDPDDTEDLTALELPD